MPRSVNNRTRTFLLISNNFSRKSDDLKKEVEVVILVNIEQPIPSEIE